MKLQKIYKQKKQVGQTILRVPDDVINKSPLKMNNNICNGYYIFSDSNKAFKQAYKVFNSLDNTFTTGSYQSASNQPYHFIKWKLKQSSVINIYSIKNPEFYGQNYTNHNISLCIREWVFQGSNNGNQWIDLDKYRLSSNEGSNGLTIRKIENKDQYIWYRLLIKDNFNNTDKNCVIGLIKIFHQI